MMLLAKRLWNSPTFTTWGSFAARTLHLAILLPLVLRFFSPAEVALWQVFSTLLGLQLLADLGFGSTFSRLISYAFGGAVGIAGDGQLQPPDEDREANWVLIARLFAVMRLIYSRLSWLLFIGLVVGGSFALVARVNALNDVTVAAGHSVYSSTKPVEAWIAWGGIVLVTFVSFRANAYAAFLQGTNHVAVVRRWEALFGVGALASSLTVLLLDGGLVALVFSSQVWILLNAWRNRWLTTQVCGGRFRRLPPCRADRDILVAAWPPAWRAGVGILMSFGVVQISAIFYAQSNDTVGVATYLLGLKLMQAVSQISQAPFYSKLPALSRLWIQGRRDEQVKLAERGMRLAYWAQVAPAIGLGFFGPWLIENIGSHTPFPSGHLWGLLIAASLCERYGAMHLQLYSTSNHIVWHVANGGAGVIFLGVATVLFPQIGVLALPGAMLAGYVGFYSWYSARLSHRRFGLKWPQFDLATVGSPALLLGIYILYTW